MAHGLMRQAVSFFVEAGASGADALAAATSVSAEACGLDDRKDWPRMGYDADILVANGDVQADVAAWPTFVRSFSVAPSLADAPQANADHGSVVVPGAAPSGETMAPVTLNWVQSARTGSGTCAADPACPTPREPAA